MKFKKKVVVVAAFQWKAGMTIPDEFLDLRRVAILDGRGKEISSVEDGSLFLQTCQGSPEDRMSVDQVRPGDWIVKDEAGGFTCCTEECFKDLYESE